MEDKLDRLPIIENLTIILEQLNLENGIVFGIDASWGKGKTTFINLWEEYIKQKHQDFDIIKFNAWENDDSGSPLLSFITELDNAFPDTELKELILESGKKIVKKIGWIALEKMSQGILSEDICKINQKNDLIKDEREKRMLKENFKKELTKLSENKKIIFFIDELDRCRPTYAIELLETIKHLFNIKNCIFIIAWDKSQLSHSIKTIYGNDMDSEGYLRRFIDLEYQLPEPNKVLYLKFLLEKEKLNDKYYPEFYSLLFGILKVYDLSLRDVDKLIFYLKIQFFNYETKNLKDTYRYITSFLKGILSVIKLKNSVLYKKIRDKYYTNNDINEILIELKIDEIKKEINTEYRGIDERVTEIMKSFLLCYLEKEEYLQDKYILFNKEGGWFGKEVCMKYFCGKNSIFTEIDFLENINN